MSPFSSAGTNNSLRSLRRIGHTSSASEKQIDHTSKSNDVVQQSGSVNTDTRGKFVNRLLGGYGGRFAIEREHD